MQHRLLADVLSGASKSALVLGPRQAGKSTLIASLRPQLTINLADEQTYLEFAANPGELTQLITLS